MQNQRSTTEPRPLGFKASKGRPKLPTNIIIGLMKKIMEFFKFKILQKNVKQYHFKTYFNSHPKAVHLIPIYII